MEDRKIDFRMVSGRDEEESIASKKQHRRR
jgi:hypothetical protein